MIKRDRESFNMFNIDGIFYQFRIYDSEIF